MPSEIDSIREQVALLGASLVSSDPEEIARRLPGVHDAIHRLRNLAIDVHDSAEIRAEIKALRSELHRVERLIQTGTLFWSGWARLLGLDTGYSQAGFIPSPADPGRLSLQG